MKKSDVAILIVIVAISLSASYFIGRAVLTSYVQSDTEVEVVDKVSSEIVQPSDTVFNSTAINPAVPINISNSNNQQPFGQ